MNMTKTKNQLEDDIVQMRENLASMDPTDSGMLDLLDRMRIAREELDTLNEYTGDIESAKYLLRKHGVGFRIFTREDVLERVRQLPGMFTAGSPYAIVAHVVEGDDWARLSDPDNVSDDAMIWEIIKGTAHDHPEWFGLKALEAL